MLKVLKTDIKRSLKSVSDRTTEGSSTMPKQFEVELTRGLERILAELKYEATKISGGLKTSLSGSTLGALRKISNCVAMLFNRLASVCEASSVKRYGSASNLNAAAAGTAQ